MSPTSSPRSVSNENRFQFLVYRESKITYHIPDKQLKLSQKHKCGDFMWLNTVMSSYRSEILQFPNRVMYAELEAYRINIWANVFPMICCYDLCIHIPQSAHHETDSNSRIELDLFPIIDFGNWNRFPSLVVSHSLEGDYMSVLCCELRN